MVRSNSPMTIRSQPSHGTFIVEILSPWAVMVKCTHSLSSRLISCLGFCQEVLIDQKNLCSILSLWEHRVRNALLSAWYPSLCSREEDGVQSKEEVIFFFPWYPFSRNGNDRCLDSPKWRICVEQFNYNHDCSVKWGISVLSLFISAVASGWWGPLCRYLNISWYRIGHWKAGM